jgi:hypothetical protein
MRLTLRFHQERIAGEGDDRVGGFTIEGNFSESSGKVAFNKTYRSHDVFYDGTWDGAMIAGTWKFKRQLRFTESHGEFEIWPEHAEESIEAQLEAQEKLEPVGV